MNKMIYNSKYIFFCIIFLLSGVALFSPASAAKATKPASEPTAAIPPDTSTIRVSLFENREPTTLRLQAMRGEWRVRLFPRPTASGSEPLLSGEETEAIPESEDIILMLTSKGITGRTSRGRELEAGYSKVELTGGETLLIEIAGRQPVMLRGKLEVSLGVNILRFVNEIPLRAYLVSSVSELTSSPEPEAVKAMIIAVRSRLVRTIIDRRHATDSVDLCDKPHCMTFSGDAPNRELVALLTDRCADEIMVSGGKPLFARFQHTCGGKISSMKDIYDIEDPNHQALDDRLDNKGSENCFHSPSFNWVREFAQEEIADFLSVMFAGGAERVFLRWEPSKTDPAGRIIEMSLRGKREKKVRGTVFLEAMQEQFGSNSLRSMRFTVEPMRRSTIYRGVGSGDGVGMCLFGADGLAKKGLDAYRILMFYYRNFEFRKAGQPLVPQAPATPPPAPGRIR